MQQQEQQANIKKIFHSLYYGTYYPSIQPHTVHSLSSLPQRPQRSYSNKQLKDNLSIIFNTMISIYRDLAQNSKSDIAWQGLLKVTQQFKADLQEIRLIEKRERLAKIIQEEAIQLENCGALAKRILLQSND